MGSSGVGQAMNQFLGYLVETSLALAWAFIFVVALIVGEVGYRCGRYRAARHTASDSERGTIGTLVAAMVTLLAFALGLTISFAQSRFETRRDLVMQEANEIGTAWLRAGLFEAPEGPRMQRLLEDYTRVRLTYVRATDLTEVPSLWARTIALQNEIWAEATTVIRRRPDPVATPLMAALNEMIDLSLSQRFAFASRVPLYLMWTILAGSLLSIGAMKFQFGIVGSRQPTLTVLLLFMWTGAIALIADLNRPRLGWIMVDPAPLVWTIEGFGPGTPPAR
jgi:hypothetical protein